MSIPNKTTLQAQNQKAIDGVDKYLGTIKTMMVAGTSYVPADLKAALQAEIDGDKAADEARSQYRQQVVAARLARAKGLAARKVLTTYVVSTYGADAVQTLENFGIPVPKARGQMAATVRAQAVTEAAATRKARKEAIASLDAPAPSATALAAAVVTPSK